MSTDEIVSFLKAVDSKNRNEWEKIRVQCYYSFIAMNGMKIFKKPAELFRLPWERIRTRKKGRKLTRQEIEKKEKQAERYLKKING